MVSCFLALQNMLNYHLIRMNRFYLKIKCGFINKAIMIKFFFVEMSHFFKRFEYYFKYFNNPTFSNLNH